MHTPDLKTGNINRRNNIGSCLNNIGKFLNNFGLCLKRFGTCFSSFGKAAYHKDCEPYNLNIL